MHSIITPKFLALTKTESDTLTSFDEQYQQLVLEGRDAQALGPQWEGLRADAASGDPDALEKLKEFPSKSGFIAFHEAQSTGRWAALNREFVARWPSVAKIAQRVREHSEKVLADYRSRTNAIRESLNIGNVEDEVSALLSKIIAACLEVESGPKSTGQVSEPPRPGALLQFVAST